MGTKDLGALRAQAGSHTSEKALKSGDLPARTFLSVSYLLACLDLFGAGKGLSVTGTWHRAVCSIILMPFTDFSNDHKGRGQRHWPISRFTLDHDTLRECLSPYRILGTFRRNAMGTIPG